MDAILDSETERFISAYPYIFKYSCNCDSLHDFVLDAGILSSPEHLPVTELYYGDSGERFSWILYQLGHL